MLNKKRIVGLDLGEQTLGIAVSDLTNIIATGVETFRFEQDDYISAINYLKQILTKYSSEIIVLGFPLNMNNTEGNSALRSRDFKSLIEENIENIEVVLQDERRSTMQAENYLLDFNLSRQKKVIDKMAAVIILQNYLDRINKKI